MVYCGMPMLSTDSEYKHFTVRLADDDQHFIWGGIPEEKVPDFYDVVAALNAMLVNYPGIRLHEVMLEPDSVDGPRDYSDTSHFICHMTISSVHSANTIHAEIAKFLAVTYRGMKDPYTDEDINEFVDVKQAEWSDPFWVEQINDAYNSMAEAEMPKPSA
jgi:hypothetical protein